MKPRDAETESLQPPTAIHLSTEDISPWHRHEWLKEIIGREYAHVDITPPRHAPLLNEMDIYTWKHLRLSCIRSNAIKLKRLPQEPLLSSQDAYFGVVLLSGEYMLEQAGREVFLSPGDMTIYDATRPHHITCPGSFSKLIISIPRELMRQKLAGVEHCTALKIPGSKGIGAVAADFMRASASQATGMSQLAFDALSDNALDLFTLALQEIRPPASQLSRSRSLSLYNIKSCVEKHLAHPQLDSQMIAQATGLSSRYINELLAAEHTSLMRHVWERRLEKAHQDICGARQMGLAVSDIAMKWGFNDLSHFSRAFKRKFGVSPRALKAQVQPAKAKSGP
ncbi:AraC-like ligand-binding domain-containing protein [Methylovorus mays]|uniref:AraC-like ligand-binding domain-containing protein n=1 Tax=Methylovorus mays TaxID=184077 RepID=UPI001E53884D|nr:helix-turn-helix domain-containing protein [Methylovorus mays]MCB5206920.1 helix-turn-helix domain-containing protein [Methylovorus mays]